MSTPLIILEDRLKQAAGRMSIMTEEWNSAHKRFVDLLSIPPGRKRPGDPTLETWRVEADVRYSALLDQMRLVSDLTRLVDDMREAIRARRRPGPNRNTS